MEEVRSKDYLLEGVVLKGNMLAVKETQYIFPPRSQDAIPLEDACLFADLGWEAQLKYNDSRCLVKFKSGGIPELWNRHAERFRTYTAPDWLLGQLEAVHEKLGLSKNEWSLLDGGLLDSKHVAIKDTIVIWDILVRDGQHLLGTTYKDRYEWVHERLTGGHVHQTTWWYTNPQRPNAHDPLPFGAKVLDNIILPVNYKGNRSPSADNDGNPSGDAWRAIWEQIVNVANAPYTIGKPGDRNYDIKPVLEGLVFKDPNGKLEMGYKEKNNSKWMVRSRVETGRHRF